MIAPLKIIQIPSRVLKTFQGDQTLAYFTLFYINDIDQPFDQKSANGAIWIENV